MKTATIRLEQRNLSEVLSRVADGETVTVTKHNEIVARIVPPRRKGRKVSWPDFSARLKKIHPRGAKGNLASQIIQKMRGERF